MSLIKKLTKKIKIDERTKVILGALAFLNVPVMILTICIAGTPFTKGSLIIMGILTVICLAKESDDHAAQNPYSWRNQPGGTHYNNPYRPSANVNYSGTSQDEWIQDFAQRHAQQANEYYQQKYEQEKQYTEARPEAESEEPPPYRPKTLLTVEQIEQLSGLREQLSVEDAQMYPVISISGPDMINLVPEAGIFTAKIKRNGELVNLIVMLATNKAVEDFAQRCYSFGALKKDFWCKGYLLPQRSDRCYTILYVYKIRVNGKNIIF